TYCCKPSPFNTPTWRENGGMHESEIAASSISSAILCRVKPLWAAAYRAATSLPALVPSARTGTTPCDSSGLVTAMWANPRAAPPPSTRPILMGTSARGSGATGIGGVLGSGEVGGRTLHANRKFASKNEAVIRKGERTEKRRMDFHEQHIDVRI